MVRNGSGPTGLTRLGTWRSGGESPTFPGSGDANRLLEAVDVRPRGGGCTLVRVRLGASDRRTLVRVRERLLGADHIVATSIGRDAGPDDQGAFDILVVPDYDPVTVGREIAGVDDVVGVAATAFESDGRHVSTARTADGDRTTVTRSTVDEAASELRTTIEASTDDAADPRDDVGSVPLGDDGALAGVLTAADERGESPDGAATTTPAVGGLAALEGASDTTSSGREPSADTSGGADQVPSDEGDTKRGARYRGETSRRGVTGSRLPDGQRRVDADGSPPAVDGVLEPTRTDRRGSIDDRLDRLDGRLSELESAIGVGDQGVTRGPEQSGEQGHPTTEELVDRIAALEATVADLERRERQLRDALVGDTD